MVIDKVKVQELIDAQNGESPFSGVVLIKERGDIVFEGAYGYANRSERIQNRVDTRFGIASGCKIFTSVAVCQLVERGLLTFDSLLKDCLDVSFPEFDPNVTVGQLLTHSSGIPDYFDEEVMSDYEDLWKDNPMYRIRSPRDFLPLFQDKDMMFKPGDRFHYNDAGFIVLGLIVEQISNMPFHEYIEANIFKPSAMTDTGYFALDRLPERVALGYIDFEDGSWKSNVYSVPVVGGPDGGCFTTATDMFKFWDALLNFRLLKEGITKEMLRPHMQADEYTHYGYGVWIIKRGDSYQTFVQGSDPGVSFMSLVSQSQDVQFAVLSNTDHGLWEICNGVAAMM